MRRLLSLLLFSFALAAIGAAPAAGAASGWHTDQPVASGIGVPAPLGQIGDIEFEAPNKGALITGGNDSLPAGVYAYDGTHWYLYSTVCGGPEGRIAWSGPDEFWTVSRYATPQEGVINPFAEEYGRTLCHFQNGAVVASYAEPPKTAKTFQQMLAAACQGPAECWFAGEELPETAANDGPFHLRWDGYSLTSVPSLTVPQPQIVDRPGKITDLDFYAGHLYESAGEKPYLRLVEPTSANPFVPIALPENEEEEEPKGPFKLATDGGQLWAFGEEGTSALHSIAGGPLEEVLLEKQLGTVRGVAPVPGEEAAWISGGGANASESATVTRVDGEGRVGEPITLPAAEEGINPKGGGGPIVCPAAGQCWLTTAAGWLFHLGGPLAPNEDPLMHVLITSRPPDDSTRSLVGSGVPEDNSGEKEPNRGGFEEPQHEPFPQRTKAVVLVTKVKQKYIGRSILQLTFVLKAPAYVRLLAEHGGKVVAKTARMTLGAGPHKIRLRLDPKRPPTKLNFQVHPVEKPTA